MTTPTRLTSPTLTFDEALAELQRTVAELEAGGRPLEASIALYERGVALHERCAPLLADAELRVQRLVERAGGALEAIELRTERTPRRRPRGRLAPGDACSRHRASQSRRRRRLTSAPGPGGSRRHPHRSR